MTTQENIPYTADEIKAMVKTCEKYNKALEKAKKLYGKYCINNVLEDLFPELKESNDERIRKTLIEYIKGIKSWNYFLGISKGQMIAWLEKQGENKSVDKPKFKVGDWITDGHLICKVLSVTGKSYELHLYNDDYCHFETDIQSVDKYYRLWAIEDAKDGDVLAEDSCIFIIRKLGDNGTAAKTYCVLHDDGDFNYDSVLYFDIDSTKPATKEQRDLLFQKMKEAGYEWDSEKKELNKIEQKNPIVNVPPRELILSIWDLGNEWKELTNGSISTEYGTQLEYIQKHWQESSYYDNIGDNIPTLTDKDYDKLFINCKH